MPTTTYTTTGVSHPAGTRFAIYDSGLLIGRIVLVLMYIFSGISKFGDLAGTAASISGKGLPVPMVLAVIAALVEVIGGLLIVLGWHTRLVSIGLLIYTVVAAYFFHDFWNMSPGPEQANAMIHAMKNLSIAAAFLMLASGGAGRYSVDAHSRI